jgi:hypothetical protein
MAEHMGLDLKVLCGLTNKICFTHYRPLFAVPLLGSRTASAFF